MRAVVVLRWYEGLTEAKTAEALGCSIGSVKSQSSRGLDRLRELLDQLARGGDRQRRRRAGLLAAGLGVVLIAAAVPAASSFLIRSEDSPANRTTVAPTPTPTAVPTLVVTPSVEAPVVDSPACPDHAAVQAALPADTARATYRAHPGAAVCSGVWAGFGYTRTEILSPGDTFQGHDDHGDPAQFTATRHEEWPDATAGLLRYENGSWTFHERDDYCDKVTLPDVIGERVCTVD